MADRVTPAVTDRYVQRGRAAYDYAISNGHSPREATRRALNAAVFAARTDETCYAPDRHSEPEADAYYAARADA